MGFTGVYVVFYMVLFLGPYITPSIKIIVKILITFHIEQYYAILTDIRQVYEISRSHERLICLKQQRKKQAILAFIQQNVLNLARL